jgi:hypothetical protein
MTLSEKLLVAALLAQLLWTFFVMGLAGRARFTAAAGNKIKCDIALSGTGWPDDVRKVANNMNNQFETPTLFYALLLLALHLHLASLVLAVLAFVFVASRVAHTHIHTSSNIVIIRARTFFVGVGALVIFTLVVCCDLIFGIII